MPLGLVLVIYNLLLPVAMLVILPGYIVKMVRRGGYRGHFRQRLGFYPMAVRERFKAMRQRPVWIHAVSVGEVLVAAKLIAELKRQAPDVPVVLSTTTSTGHAVALERFGEHAVVIYNPVDFPPVASRVFSLLRPRQLVLVEAEVWPNLVWIARRRSVPVFLVNARLSPRSERRFLRFRAFVRPIFAMLDHVFVPFTGDAARFAAIGVRPEVIAHPGSIKYDPGPGTGRPESADQFQCALARLFGSWKPRVFLAGSTHAGEEQLLGGVIVNVRREVGDLFPIMVPRHVERTAEVVAQLRDLGFRPLRRSEMDAQPDGICDSARAGGAGFDCLVVDTTGELQAWYFTADAVVIGKSFLSRGGQNPVEPILAGKPVLFGPEMGNFPVLAETLVASGGARQVRAAADLADVLVEILSDPAKGAEMVRRARDVIATHEGATARTATAILAA